MLYAVGSGTINKIYKDEAALQHGKGYKHAKHPELKMALRQNTRTRWTGILMYFWVMYHNVAEVLPAKFEMPTFAEYSSTGNEVVAVDSDELSITSTVFCKSWIVRYTIQMLPTWGPEL